MMAGPYAYLLAVAVGFGGGWAVNGYRLGADLSELQGQHDRAIAVETTKTKAAQDLLQTERDTKQKAIDAVEATALTNTQKAENETRRLRTCIANGTCGLRVNTIAGPACTTGVPGTGQAVSVGATTGTRLTADAEQAYYTLRDGIARTQQKLTALQASCGPDTSK